MLIQVLQPLQISAFRMTGLFGVDTLGRIYTLSYLSSAPLRTSPAPSRVAAAPAAAPAFKKFLRFIAVLFSAFFIFVRPQIDRALEQLSKIHFKTQRDRDSKCNSILTEAIIGFRPLRLNREEFSEFEWRWRAFRRMPEIVAHPSRQVSQPTGDKQRKEERSLHKLQSPAAKLSNLFTHCQEIGHRYVTSVAQ